MKNTIPFLGIAVVLTAFSNNAISQVTASATATATIVRPIAITKETDMNFGNVAVNSSAGTVVLTPSGTRSATGGVTLPATVGTVAAASFEVKGEDDFTYSISLPTSHYILEKQGSGNVTMRVLDFTSSPSGTGTLASGDQTLNVGATLEVGGSQAAGIYTNSTGFEVTVNYN